MNIKKTCLGVALFFIALLVLSAVIALLKKDTPLGEKIALVRVEGPILEAKDTVDTLKEYANDSSVKAIVLRVNSPGGGVVPSQEIYSEVKRAAAAKKVVVSMGSVAASGGYYIAAPASRIIANPGTLTGSIGVIMEVPNLQELMKKIGVTTEVIKSGAHKDIASIFRGVGPEERAILQGVMDDVHEQFISAVADGRKLPLDDVRKIADGRVFSGRQALAVKLVDELGDLDAAVKIAAKLAGIEGEPQVVSKKEKSPLMDLLGGDTRAGLLKILPRMELKYMFTL